MGYYDHHPTRSLVRPLVLSGPAGVPVTQVALQLAVRSGLPHHDLVRAVEHTLGASVHQVFLERGGCEYRRLEATALRAALDGRPAGIVALSPHTIADPASRGRVLADGVLVHLRGDPEWLTEVLLHPDGSTQALFSPWVGGFATATELALALSQQEADHELATLSVDTTRRHPDRIVEELLGLLELRPC